MSDTPIELQGPDGLRVSLFRHGAALGAITLDTPDGRLPMCLSYPRWPAEEHYYLGVVAGRFANRIGGSRVELDGQSHQLVANEGSNCLHGGEHGFDKRLWQLTAQGQDAASFALVSEHGDQGFPGTLKAQVHYALLSQGRLQIRFEAETDRPTVVNMCNHSYFHLGATDLRELTLWHRAERYLAIDSAGIPTGELMPVAGTPLDFRQTQGLGQALVPFLANQPDGVDHALVLSEPGLAEPALSQPVAVLSHPRLGVRMRLYTDQPALQLYTGQHLGAPFAPHQGVCLEAEGFPDAPNHPHFPSCRLEPGQRYQKTVVYQFDRQG